MENITKILLIKLGFFFSSLNIIKHIFSFFCNL